MGDVFLFTASRLVLSRGVEDIIYALAHLPENVKLLIAGDGEDREKLEAIAEKSRVRERVVFVGHIGHEKLPQYFKVSDIFVRPSLIEGMGSAFRSEAIAEKSRVRERVVFVGHIGHEKLPQYFKVSDIFVRPSLIEGMGSAF